jgi:hypothetical protein
LPYNLELKPDHIADLMIYIKKADYALYNTTKNINDWLLKSRGVSKLTDKRETGYWKIIQNIEHDIKIEFLDHKETHIITIHDYLDRVTKNNKLRKDNLPLLPEIIPGYTEIRVRNFHYDGLFMSKSSLKHYNASKAIAKKHNYTERLMEETFQTF